MSTDGDHWARQTYESLPILFLLLLFYCRRSAEVPPTQVRIRHREPFKKTNRLLTVYQVLMNTATESGWVTEKVSPYLFCIVPVGLFRFQPEPLIVTNSDICACGSQKRRLHSQRRCFVIFFPRVPRAEEPAKGVSTKISRKLSWYDEYIDCGWSNIVGDNW